MSGFFYFWGCQIPARIPFIEKSVRLVIERLGYKIQDMPGFTCCPEEALVHSLGEDVWELTAVRNLANAERHQRGAVLVTPCNGCSATFKSVLSSLYKEPGRLKEINKQLAGVGLKYDGTVKVLHLVEFLHNIVGIDKIKKSIELPLAGMNIAVHPGCHFSSPAEAVKFDDPINPVTLDNLVTATGANDLDYAIKKLCCGQDLANTGHIQDSLQMLRQKVLSAQHIQADALCVACPACFLQFDHRQYMLAKQGEQLSTPVFFITELLGLAMGFSPEDLRLRDHRISTDTFLSSWQKNLESYRTAEDMLDLDMVRACIDCGACENDCPSALVQSEFEPHEILSQLLEGKIDQVLEDGKFWYCMQCHTCYELCPQRFGMEKVFQALRGVAVEHGKTPSGIKTGLDYFEKTALLGEPAEKQRNKLGLAPLPESGAAELLKILEKIKGKK